MLALTCEKINVEKFYLTTVLKDDQETSKLGDGKEEARRRILSQDSV